MKNEKKKLWLLQFVIIPILILMFSPLIITLSFLTINFIEPILSQPMIFFISLGIPIFICLVLLLIFKKRKLKKHVFVMKIIILSILLITIIPLTFFIIWFLLSFLLKPSDSVGAGRGFGFLFIFLFPYTSIYLITAIIIKLYKICKKNT